MHKIAFCITCRNRLDHLTATLPRNIEHAADYSDVIFILLDYNDTSGLDRYIQNEHKHNLDSGRLVYYRNPSPTRFKMAHAKNMAHRCGIIEGADIMVNLDADNWTGNRFANYVDYRFSSAIEDREAIFLGTKANHQGPGELVKVRTPPGCSGRIAVSKQAFLHSGGYDEIFEGWSPDDKDFGARLLRLGYGWRQIRPDFLSAIKHGAGLRFQDYERQSGDVALNELFTLNERQNMRVVNSGIIGTGQVYRNFENRTIDMNPIPTRIFGIGMHKTATTSLSRAFRMLGYDSAHWESPHWAKRIWDEMQAEKRSRTLEMHYALCDLPIPILYRELDWAYPGSKFVLTIRNDNEWLASVKTHWELLRHSWDGDVFSNEMHRIVYGTTDFDENIFLSRYRRHNEEVLDYFRNRSSDLLMMNMSQGAGWKELCGFLDVPMREGPFPRNHESAKQDKYQKR